MKLGKETLVLDLGCGEGVFSRVIPQVKRYTGIDIAKGLIEEAKEKNTKKECDFIVGDASGMISLDQQAYDYAVCILAIQNIENTVGLIRNVTHALKPGGSFFIVMNHPYFRIPKSTSWEIDEQREIQFRRVDKYLTPHAIPIDMTPGRNSDKKITTSFHFPLSYLAERLTKNGMVIGAIDEWISPKRSEGRYAFMENRARNEIPMFMCVEGRKLSIS